MNQFKLVLVIFLLLIVGIMFAQNATVSYKDNSSPLATYTKLNLEYPGGAYPTGITTGRWKVQFYKDGGDNIINPLSITNHLSSGDDLPLTNVNNFQDVTITVVGPNKFWNATGIIFPLTGTENGHIGDKVFAVIYNSTTIAAASKYMILQAFYTITTASAQNVFINTTLNPAGWSNWIPFEALNVVPNPAVLVYPANNAIDLGYATQTLSWTAGTGAAPTGYKFYFGTDNPPTNIVNGTTQTTTTHVTGPLLQNQAYFWKVVPFNAVGDATNCPIWTFNTRIEHNPNPATNPTPTDGSTFEVASFPYNQNISWSAPTTGVTPTGYKLFWNLSNTAEDLGNVLTTSKSIPSSGTYSWKIVPYYIDPGTRSEKLGKPLITTRPINRSRDTNNRGDAINCPTWTFTFNQAITYTVDITSTPVSAAIFVNGVNSGFTTPHLFTLAQGASATYTVQQAGYTWAPTSFVVNNIQANTSQSFTGTIITYNANVTSNPTGAEIFVGGVDSGFTTPHTFVMNYGTSATYTVQKPGYTWLPISLVVTNIQADVNIPFQGTIITYTVDITSTPINAQIFVDGVNSGFTTPHQFVMNYGTSAAYTIQQAGYSWAPGSFTVTNIQANTSQNFVGTILTYSVDLTSNPSNALIYVNGVSSGFNTPHQFVMNYGANATYTVQLTGYSWVPASFVVTNIQANTSQNFVGTLSVNYTVNITSTPTDADIFIGGVDTGFNTPHVFDLLQGSNATYSVQKAGYTWAPTNLVITNIQANTSQNFTGTLLTYTVNITSTPTDSDIFADGTDTGFNTPHVFSLNYGTSVTYTVSKAGYLWNPASFVVTNIQANTSQAFTGTLLTYTVDITSTPIDADIFVGGIDTGFNTPHQFVLNYGSNATYTVQKAGYTWTPTNLVITNIQANTSQAFIGTIITYTVDVSSVPTDADIYLNEVDTGFNTPHVFTVNYGFSGTYTVHKTGYSYTPASLVVTNIQANASQVFTGTLLTYTVDITSAPVDADIFVNGIDSGFNTPHQFILNYGSSAIYTVAKTGYTWAPSNFTVTNIIANTSQNFTGTIITFTVDITSVPSDANIFVNGIDSGFNTPHQFVMNYGTSAVYSTQKEGYNYTPLNLTVTNILANTGQNFTGTIQTFNVDISSSPLDADIFVNGSDSGFNTPHTFILNYGSSATYSVSKAGYGFTPAQLIVTDIHENMSQLFTGSILTYVVDITSTPAEADIFVGGVDTGFNTPHQFVMNWHTSAIYSVQKAGYTWAPGNFVVNNIQANTSQNFTGTIITYTANITSNPTNADIFVGGVDTGFNTPHQFVMNYGTSALYTVQKTGYTWNPASFTITNIIANTSQNFTGTLLTYTVNISSEPTGADIFVGGIDTGVNTPYQFTLSYGASATYTVQKAGYTWSPANFVVNNITANTSQNFTGTLLTYTVDITSAPADADIFVGGIDTGFNTPHVFTLNYGSYANYTVQKAGYTWLPANFVINNIQANTSQNFVGTILTFNVVITSEPADADIFVGGVDTGYNTPHQFVMNYGSSATYTVQKTGYTWSPASFVINNIQTNASQNFTGTLLTYTVNITSTPSDADIFVDGSDSGFNTPHIFTLNYGSSAYYTIQKAGYTWSPTNFIVTNITANTSQLFTGTILTYTVNITSNPTNADILIGGVDTGFNTPHVFTMNYGTSATYTLFKTGYIWAPANLVVTSIHANTSQLFTGIPIALNVAPANRNVSYQSGTTTFAISSNIAWTVTEAVTWLSVAPISGSNNGTLVVSYDTNNFPSERTAQITIAGGSIVRTVTVTQAPAPATLEVTPQNQNVDYPAGTTNFTINSNSSWIVTEVSDWFSISPLSGTTSGTIVVTFNANPATTPRSGQIVVTANELTQTVTVSQAGAPANLTVTPETINVNNLAGTTEFVIDSNIAWTITESESWLSIAPRNGDNGGNITITYNANTTASSRSGLITVSGSGLTRTVQVNQSGAPIVLIVSPMQQTVSNIAGTTVFTVNSNAEWTVSETEDWLSLNPTPAKNVLGTFEINYLANPVATPRIGHVTVTSGEVTRVVTITQTAGVGTEDPTQVIAPMINVYPNPFVSTTNIKVGVNNSNVNLAVYSAKGQLVKTLGSFTKGSYIVSWDGKDDSGKSCSSGFYFVRYRSAEVTKTIKVSLLKK